MDFWFWYKWIMIVAGGITALKLTYLAIRLIADNEHPAGAKFKRFLQLTAGGIFRLVQSAFGLLIFLGAIYLLWLLIFWIFGL